jgi:DNA-binding CsgD family transcriptional regulator
MDVSRWVDALGTVAPMFNGRGAQIAAGTGLDAVSFLKIWGWSDEELGRFLPRYLELTPSDPRGNLIATTYKPMHCRQFVSDETLWASDIYKEILSQVGVEYIMTFTVPIREGFLCVLGVMRGREQGVFTTSNCSDFSRFMPHIARAVSMHGTFHQCREELATVKGLLDGVPLGMMVVSGDELKVANRSARELLDQGEALRSSGGQLRGATRQANNDLQDAIREAQDGRGKTIGLALPIDHAEPMRAVVRQLNPGAAGMLNASDAAVALYVSDPRKPVETSEEVLQRLFGLTPREAAVLRVLAEGGDLRLAAERLDITHETVRSHLKHIMETTGARRQVDLVRMVLSSPAWIAVKSVHTGM